MENKDLEYIKKHYSETLAKLCRKYFSTLLETPGLLPKLLERNFAHSKSLGQDIIDQGLVGSFRVFIVSQSPYKNIYSESDKTAVGLMDEAGYILYPECKTEDDIQSFRHYYVSANPNNKKTDNGMIESWSGEELCTFDGGRLDEARVWFAVKKDVDEIKREDFTKPERQDRYGTSVISIQFTKGRFSELSIKCRYNHRVENPDATFSNNLDNIIPGLTSAFERDFGVKDIDHDDIPFMPSHYTKCLDGKFYRYNMYDEECFYCENNTIVKDGIAIKYPDYKLIMDNYVLDIQKKELSLINKDYSKDDGFIKCVGEIDKIEITKQGRNKDIKITSKNGFVTYLTIDYRNNITKFVNNDIEEVGSNFLSDNIGLETLEMKKLKTCGSMFLHDTENLQTLILPSLEQCGNRFITKSKKIKSVDLPSLKVCGDRFMQKCYNVETINMPSLEQCGNMFLKTNNLIKSINFPNLVKCGSDFLLENETLEEVNLPKLKFCIDAFLYQNKALKHLSLPSLTTCGGNFMFFNQNLESVNLPSLTNCDINFLSTNNSLTKIELPSLTNCTFNFMDRNTVLKEISLPKLTTCGGNFLASNNSLTELSLPLLQSCGQYFLNGNNSITKINLPSLTNCDKYFMMSNRKIKTLSLPSLYICGNNFMMNNKALETIDLPKLVECGDDFLFNCESITSLSLPYLGLCGDCFLYHNKILNEINLPSLTTCGTFFLNNNQKLESISLPALKYMGIGFMDNNEEISFSKMNLPKIGIVYSKNILEKFIKRDNAVTVKFVNSKTEKTL